MSRARIAVGVVAVLAGSAACEAKSTPEGAPSPVASSEPGAGRTELDGGDVPPAFVDPVIGAKKPGRAPPYTCAAPPKQCELVCDAPVCTQVCNPRDATDCRWDCAAPTCHCGAQPTASCDLYDPPAPCDVKCEKPICTEYCPRCTSLPCAPCETVCAPVHCVSHCQAPTVPSSGAQRVTHCMAPRPSCAGTCAAPPTCRWDRVPACDGDAGACPPIDHYEPTCEQTTCHTKCEPIPNARCVVSNCEEACDPVTDCAVACDKPACTVASDGSTTCDPPTGCTNTCKGGLCRVTTCN